MYMAGSSATTDLDKLGDVLESHLLAEAGNLLLAKTNLHSKNKSSPKEHANTDWSYLYSEDEIAVFRKTTDDCCYAGEGLIDVPLHQVAELVKDIESSYIWEKYLVEARCIKVLSASESCIDYLGYERFQTNSCLFSFRRDMLYFNRCVYKDGKYIQSQMSVEDPDCPLREKTPRIDVKKGTGFILEPYEGKTLATFYFNMDLKGLPRFMTTRIVRTYPLVIRDIRQYLAGRDSLDVPGFADSHSLSLSVDDSVSMRPKCCRNRARTHTSAHSGGGRRGRREEGEEGEAGGLHWKSGVLSVQYDEPMSLDHYLNSESK